MQLILLAVAGIIWAVIKAASQPPPQRPVPRSVAPGQKMANVSTPPTESNISKPYVPQQRLREISLEVEELGTASKNFEFTGDTLVQGIIMAEVLGPPRAKNPHKIYRRVR